MLCCGDRKDASQDITERFIYKYLLDLRHQNVQTTKTINVLLFFMSFHPCRSSEIQLFRMTELSCNDFLYRYAGLVLEGINALDFAVVAAFPLCTSVGQLGLGRCLAACCPEHPSFWLAQPEGLCHREAMSTLMAANACLSGRM